MRGKRGKILKNFPSLPPRPHLSFQNFLIFMGGENRGGGLIERGPPSVERTLSGLLSRHSVSPKKHLEISSFDTTVRLLSDRSRPPQVGPTGHTCTETADRTAPARHAIPRSPGLSKLPSSSATPFAFTLPPAEGEAFGGNRGARGELFPPHAFPVFSVFSAFLGAILALNVLRPPEGSSATSGAASVGSDYSGVIPCFWGT